MESGRDFTFPTEWQQIIDQASAHRFAWGRGRRRGRAKIGAIEIAIAAGKGGSGSVWIDDLKLEEREPRGGAISRRRCPRRRSSRDTSPRSRSTSAETSWRSGTLAPEQWLLLDFRRRREYGGLVIDWDPDDYATGYQVQVSDDGENWTTVYSTVNGNGGRDYIYMPDGESRYVRLELERSSREQGYGVEELTVEPFEFSASPNQFFEAIARDAPTGTYPKYFTGKQTYWTVIGARGDDKEALMNEEGMLEVDKGAFSIEPFLYADGNLVTWNDVQTAQELERGYLPIPSVTWQTDQLGLTITAFAAGTSGESVLYARYRVENRGDAPRDVSLYVTVRPFQVLPPWQSLNMVGGVTPIRDLRLRRRAPCG